MKRGLPWRIRSERIRREVVIKGNLFLEDNHQVFNRSGGITCGPHQWGNTQQEYQRRNATEQPFRRSPLSHIFFLS